MILSCERSIMPSERPLVSPFCSVVGALEYDPELRCHKIRHRHFLKEKARFRQVIPFGDAAVLKKVHQNFYLGFLKDVVLPRALDDNTFAALNQLQFFNNVQIVTSLTNDGPFIQGLRDKLATAEALSFDEQLDALRLLQELCTIAKTLQLYHRANFYRRVVEHGYFAPLADFLTRPEPALRLATIEILLSSTQHDPSLLRTHVLQQRPNGPMLRNLLRVLTSEDSNGEKPQITEVLRLLLDPEGMEGREQDDFLNLFYENYVHQLAEPVAGPVSAGTGPLMNGSSTISSVVSSVDVPDGVVSTGNQAAPKSELDSQADGVLSARQYVCELLCFCVTKHSYRIKYFILRNNILFKVLKLASHKDKSLVLASVRFFRTCIGLKDEFYNRYIVKNRCFDPVLTQLYENRTRDNLLHSAILELFEFIRRENIKSLISHIVDAYEERLKPLSHSDIFKGLLIKYDQNEEFRNAGGSGMAPSGNGSGGSISASGGSSTFAGSAAALGARRAANVYVGARRAFPDEDEDSAYFNASDDDEEDGSTAATAPVGDSVQDVNASSCSSLSGSTHADSVSSHGAYDTGSNSGSRDVPASLHAYAGSLATSSTFSGGAGFSEGRVDDVRGPMGGYGSSGLGPSSGALPLAHQRDQLSWGETAVRGDGPVAPGLPSGDNKENAATPGSWESRPGPIDPAAMHAQPQPAPTAAVGTPSLTGLSADYSDAGAGALVSSDLPDPSSLSAGPEYEESGGVDASNDAPNKRQRVHTSTPA